MHYYSTYVGDEKSLIEYTFEAKRDEQGDYFEVDILAITQRRKVIIKGEEHNTSVNNREIVFSLMTPTSWDLLIEEVKESHINEIRHAA